MSDHPPSSWTQKLMRQHRDGPAPSPRAHPRGDGAARSVLPLCPVGLAHGLATWPGQQAVQTPDPSARAAGARDPARQGLVSEGVALTLVGAGRKGSRRPSLRPGPAGRAPVQQRQLGVTATGEQGRGIRTADPRGAPSLAIYLCAWRARRPEEEAAPPPPPHLVRWSMGFTRRD